MNSEQKITEQELRNDFDSLQGELSKWIVEYQLPCIEGEELSGIHYIKEHEFNYKISTSSGGSV